MTTLNKIKSNPLISKITGNKTLIQILIIIIVIIVAIILMHLLRQFVIYTLTTKHDKPMILEASKNAKNSMIILQDPSSENSIVLYRSDDKSGIEFSYSVWFVIDNMEYMFGKWKHMFHKGNKTSYPNRAPGVFIHPDKNALRIYMNTLENILEYVDIENIPIKRWIHMVISLNHKYLDIYINGRLKKRHEFTSTPKQNYGDLWLNLFGGFEGYLCRMQYFRKALSYQEVESITSQGPSNESCVDGGGKPPYLDDTWWYD